MLEYFVEDRHVLLRVFLGSLEAAEDVEPLGLLPGDVEFHQSDEGRDLQEEINQQGQPGVQSEGLHGGHS